MRPKVWPLIILFIVVVGSLPVEAQQIPAAGDASPRLLQSFGETPNYRSKFICRGVSLLVEPLCLRLIFTDSYLINWLHLIWSSPCNATSRFPMANSLTHFEIYGEQPTSLAEFYSRVFGWQVEQVEQMEAVDYWRINTGSGEANTLNGGLTYRAIPGLNGWMLYVHVPTLDDTVELIQSLGGSVRWPAMPLKENYRIRRVTDFTHSEDEMKTVL